MTNSKKYGTAVRKSIFFFQLLGIVFTLGTLPACAGNMEKEHEIKKSQFAIETQHIQIGCCWKMDYSEERKWNTRPWLRIGFPFWWNNIDQGDAVGVNGLVLSPFGNLESGGVNGVAVAPVFLANVCNGLVFAPLASGPACLNGISFGTLNLCFDGNSVQFGVLNWRGAWGRFSGQQENGFAQIGVYNKDFWGIHSQIGAVNDSGNIPYLQIGLLNLADCTGKTTRTNGGKYLHVEKKKHFAMQIGLWNSNGRWSFPFLNVIW